MTFPVSPTNGQSFTNAAGTTFVFNSALNVWRKQAGSGSGITFTTSATAPASPRSGDEWFSTTDDALYVRVNDGTQNMRMDVSTAGTSGTTLPASAAGLLRDNGSGTLSWGATTWTTAGRPASGYTGQIGLNTTTGFIKVWNGASWVAANGSASTSLPANASGSDDA